MKYNQGDMIQDPRTKSYGIVTKKGATVAQDADFDGTKVEVKIPIAKSGGPKFAFGHHKGGQTYIWRFPS